MTRHYKIIHFPYHALDSGIEKEEGSTSVGQILDVPGNLFFVSIKKMERRCNQRMSSLDLIPVIGGRRARVSEAATRPE